MNYRKVSSEMNLPKVEEEILRLWDEKEIFKKSLENRKDAPLYSFYDGPPFATGTPHYGHLVASTMKDIVPRYWTMKGFNVPRKWGWDCHGLPIENIAEKALGIKHKKEIEEIGIDKFNETCRSKVLEYVGEWERVIRRLGRWADMKNSYKTMDMPFMESVWNVFKQLWDKGLVYESYRSMHICPRCETTLSQSEVAEGYKDIKDLSVIAEFELVDEPGTFVLAWTTTPWTLIGNVALAVGADIKYVKIEKKDQGSGELIRFILSKELLPKIFPSDEYKVVEEFDGADLVGKSYKPLFDYYSNDEKLENRGNGWKIYPANFVTTEDGTGVVHIAPAFGEDDMNLGKKMNLPFVQHVGMDGIIKSEAGEFASMNVKPADNVQKTDVEIIKHLASKKLLFDKAQYEHSYPHCWRCDTPLINYATSSWFVDVSKIKDRSIELAKEINWSPKHIKAGRFGKWLEGARDWSISRQRFWASVIPLWVCDKCGEQKVFGSVSDLEEASGDKITDLHKHVIDKVVFKCEKCQGEMKRIPDVLDTWFDSGSMPYAQAHYPFENKEQFEGSFPAEFIAEGVDQTRAWFYYLHLISTANMDKPAFKNVVVNGIVLAEDGKKMSKRLNNYPDPSAVFDKYGADALRLYFASSPVMAAENINFSEKDMTELTRGVFRMLWNSYSFFVLYAEIDKWEAQSSKLKAQSENILDQWIVSELNTLIQEVNAAMDKYELTKTARLFAPFIDNLSNWYIRRSRKRFWKSDNDSDKESAYATLHKVLVELSKLVAPFTPFIAEEIFTNLTDKESVHLEDFPKSEPGLIDTKLNDQMVLTRKIIEIGLAERAKAGIKVRQPLHTLSYGGGKLDEDFEQIIIEEVNVKATSYESNMKEDEVKIDTEISPELKEEGLAREIVRSIQSLRKKSGFEVDDRIEMYYETDSDVLKSALKNFGEIISKEILAKELSDGKSEAEGEEEAKIEGESLWVGIKRTK